MADNKHVYHVCGSPTSEFFHELSLIYAKNTILPKGWKEDFIVIEPNGSWRIGHSLSQLSDARASKEIINNLHKGSLIVPHLFCYEGMTACRDFFEKNSLINNQIQPNINDWINHLSTLFPQVRLKQFLEIRSMDACSWDLICSQPAFWTGLIYNENSFNNSSLSVP